MEQHVFTPSGELNFDTVADFIPQGDYQATNMDIDVDLNRGRIGVLRGNTSIPNAELPSGQNTTIGEVEDNENNVLIYAVHNSLQQHTIWQYNRNTATTTKVLQSPLLNFREGVLLDMRVIDGLLYFCQYFYESFSVNNGIQNFIPPRKINIQKAIDFTAGTGGYDSLDNQVLDLIKYPHLFPPLAAYNTDNTILTNNLKNRQYQFAVQYIYDDNEPSRWSPISKTPIPERDEAMGGVIPINPSQDNYISLQVNSGHHTVSKIRVAFREGNNGVFYIFREIDKEAEGVPDYGSISVRFYNNERIKAVETLGENYDAIPHTCASLEYLHKNVLSLSNNLEGFDRALIDVEIGEELVDIGSAYDILEADYQEGVTTPLPSSPVSTHIRFFPNQNSNYFLPEGTVIRITVLNNIGGVAADYVYTLPSDHTSDDLDAVLVAIVDLINSDLPPILSGASITASSPSPLQRLTLSYFNGTSFAGVRVSTYLPNKRYRSWKQGAEHPFAIQYYDRANRDGTVIYDDMIKVYIPSPYERTLDQDLTPSDADLKKVNILMTLHHRPPLWATHYQFLYKGNSTMSSWQQRTVRKIDFDPEETGRLRLSLEKHYKDTYRGATYHHQIQVGDVVRVLRQRKNPDGTGGNYLQDPVVTQVYKYSESEGELDSEAIWVDFFDYSSVVLTNESFLIEIYTPKLQGGDEVWQEIGECFSILNPHGPSRSHAGNNQNQQSDLSAPAIVRLSDGDCFLRLREMGTGYTDLNPKSFSYMIEDPHYSDYFVSNNLDYGRLGLYDINAKLSRNIGQSRHSGVLIEGSNINSLSTFRGLNFLDVGTMFGPITRAVEVGYTLKLVCFRKVHSVYIGRQETVQPNGQTDQASISDIYGSFNPSEEDWGCLDGRAVVKHDRALYYIDVMNQCFVANYANGQVAISRNNKVNSAVSQLLKSLQEDGGNLLNHKLMVGVDPKTDRVFFFVKKFTVGIPQAFVYSHKDKKFTSIHTWEPDYYSAIGNNLYSFKNGVLYNHTTGQGKRMYDEYLECSIKFFVNKNPLVNKLMELIIHDGLGAYDIVRVIAISGSGAGDNGILVKQNFIEREGRFSSVAPGALNDTSVEVLNPLIKQFVGRRIIGKCVSFEFVSSAGVSGGQGPTNFVVNYTPLTPR